MIVRSFLLWLLVWVCVSGDGQVAGIPRGLIFLFTWSGAKTGSRRL